MIILMCAEASGSADGGQTAGEFGGERAPFSREQLAGAALH